MGLNDFRYQILENNNNTYTIFDSYNDETIRDQLTSLQFAKGVVCELNTDYYFNIKKGLSNNTIELYMLVKPYLDKGCCLTEALRIVKNIDKVDCHKNWYKDLRDHVKLQGYSIRNAGVPKREVRDDLRTGFYRVAFCKSYGCRQGFTFQYRFHDDDGRFVNISCVDLVGLRDKVLNRGFEWSVVDLDKARGTCEKYGYDFEELK